MKLTVKNPEIAAKAVSEGWDATRTELEVLIGTGLRSEELLNLQLSDIEFPSEANDGACYLHLSVTKGSRPRTVPVPPRVQEWLARWVENSAKWRAANGVTADYLFHQTDKAVFGKYLDKPQTTRNLRAMIHAVVTRALGEEATQRISAHTFRRLYITGLIRERVPIMYVQKIAGHKNPATTAIYVIPEKRDLYRAVVGE